MDSLRLLLYKHKLMNKTLQAQALLSFACLSRSCGSRSHMSVGGGIRECIRRHFQIVQEGIPKFPGGMDLCSGGPICNATTKVSQVSGSNVQVPIVIVGYQIALSYAHPRGSRLKNIATKT